MSQQGRREFCGNAHSCAETLSSCRCLSNPAGGNVFSVLGLNAVSCSLYVACKMTPVSPRATSLLFPCVLVSAVVVAVGQSLLNKSCCCMYVYVVRVPLCTWRNQSGPHIFIEKGENSAEKMGWFTVTAYLCLCLFLPLNDPWVRNEANLRNWAVALL